MSIPDTLSLTMTDFSMKRVGRTIDQARTLDWLAKIHAMSETTARALDLESSAAFEDRIAKVLARCGCSPTKIASRDCAVPDVGLTDWSDMSIYDVSRNPRGSGTCARSRFFDDVVSAYFNAEYAAESVPPSDLIHVTCTGYLSPSGAQKLVAQKGWGQSTRVTHAYQMGCYAAFPALRIAAGFLGTSASLTSSTTPSRVDIVHTELCSLHLDPSDHALEQLVVQSLFADGLIRYAVRHHHKHSGAGTARGLRILALNEELLPDSAQSMSWTVSDAGMQMTLARDVPAKIASCLRAFVRALYEKAGMNVALLRESVAAVHPGGPKIIDGVQEVLELSELQVRTSREVLLDRGNMSSATLPHIWMRMVDDDDILPGTLIVSLAFGPGLTVCGGLFQKV